MASLAGIISGGAAGAIEATIDDLLISALFSLFASIGIALPMYESTQNKSKNNALYKTYLNIMENDVLSQKAKEDKEFQAAFEKMYVERYGSPAEYIRTHYEECVSRLFDDFKNNFETSVSSANSTVGTVVSTIKNIVTFSPFVLKVARLIGIGISQGVINPTIEDYVAGGNSDALESQLNAKDGIIQKAINFESGMNVKGYPYYQVPTPDKMRTMASSGYPYVQGILVKLSQIAKPEIQTPSLHKYEVIWVATTVKVSKISIMTATYVKSLSNYYYPAITLFDSSGSQISNMLLLAEKPCLYAPENESTFNSPVTISYAQQTWVSNLNTQGNWSNNYHQGYVENPLYSIIFGGALILSNMTISDASVYNFDSKIGTKLITKIAGFVSNWLTNKIADITRSDVITSEKVNDYSLTVTVPTDVTDTLSKALSDAIEAASSEAYAKAIEAALSIVMTNENAVPYNPAITIDDIKTAIKDALNANNSLVTTPDNNIVNSSSDGFLTIYRFTDAQLNTLGSHLWSTDFFTLVRNSFISMYSNPVDAIINAYSMPYSVAGALDYVTIGNIKFDGSALEGVVQAYKISNRISPEIDLGTITVPRILNNFLDFEPFTKIQLYLPFIGIVPLSTNDVMGANIKVVYKCDLFTGSMLASVRVTKGNYGEPVMYQFSGNMGMSLPLTSSNYSRMFASGIGAVASVGTAIATGGTSAMIGAAASGGAVSTLTSGVDIQRSGSMTGNTGALGDVVPYIIVERPITSIPNGYASLTGYVSNAYTKIGNLSGFNTLDSFDLNTVNKATDSEKNELDSILRSGFFI